MRRIIKNLISLVMLISCFTMFVPITAAAAEICWVLTFTFLNETQQTDHIDGRITDRANLAATYGSSGTLTLEPGATGVLRLAAFVPVEVFPIGYLSASTLTFVSGNRFSTDASACTISSSVFGQITDGRINAFDLAAPLAAYCEGKAVVVYDINSQGQGTFAFTATRAEIDAALAQAKASGQNVLIAEGLGNSLYALSSNELMLVGPDVKEPNKIYQRIIPAGVCV